MDGAITPQPASAGPAPLSPQDEVLTELQQRMDALTEAVQAMATGAVGGAKRDDLASKVGGLQQSAEIGDLAMALAAAQAELQNPGLNREAKVELKGGGGYAHKFADLPEILATIRPVLGKHGIAFIQVPTVTGGTTFLITRLMHSSGQWLQSQLPLPPIGGDRIQSWGGALTFLKRYSISAIIGVAGGDEDDDGNAWVGNKAEVQYRDRGPAAPDRSLPRGEAARRRKAADDEADRRAAAGQGAEPPPDTPGDPGPQPEAGPAQGAANGADAQKALRDLSKGLKEFFDPSTGEINIPGAEAAWLAAGRHMVGVPQHTVDTMVDRYRNVFRRDPPAIDGVTYAPVPEAAHA